MLILINSMVSLAICGVALEGQGAPHRTLTLDLTLTLIRSAYIQSRPPNFSTLSSSRRPLSRSLRKALTLRILEHWCISFVAATQDGKGWMDFGPAFQEFCSFSSVSVGISSATHGFVICQWCRNSQWCKHVLWNPWGFLIETIHQTYQKWLWGNCVGIFVCVELCLVTMRCPVMQTFSLKPLGLWKRQFTKYTKNGFEGLLCVCPRYYRHVQNLELGMLSGVSIFTQLFRSLKKEIFPDYHIFGFKEGWLIRRTNVNRSNELGVALALESEPHKSTRSNKGFEKVPSDTNILSEVLGVHEGDSLPNIPKMALRAAHCSLILSHYLYHRKL